MNKARPHFFNHAKPTVPPPHSTTAATTTTIINRLSSEGAHCHALLTYTSMLRTHTPPDRYTFPSLLKACASLKLLSHGISLHQHAIASGFSSDQYTGSSLINFYGKFGNTCHARKVFDRLPDRNVVSWTAIIGCYSRADDVYAAFCLYNRMRNEGVQPSGVTMIALLYGVSNVALLQCLHASVIHYGFLPAVAVMNSMLNVYSKLGRIEDASGLFESMDVKDIVSWNSLVGGFAVTGYIGMIVQLLYRMRVVGVEPDQQTFGSLVSAAARQSNLEMGKLVHGQILTAGIDLDVQIKTSLIVMYFKCGNVDYAFQIFERAADKDVVLWTAMISGLVQNERATKALALFHSMLTLQVIPSTATFASALAACAQLGSFNLGASIHGHLLRQRVSVDIPTHNSLVTLYAKCGHLEQSSAIFNMMQERDVVSWNAIIAGHAQAGHLCEALCLFNQMRKTFQRPDFITAVSLLQMCACTGALHQGKWIHNFIVRNCLEPCLMINTALVDMYSKCGDLHTATKCFDRMPQHDLVSWSTIIAGYGYHGKGETALEMYMKFLRTGLEPNHVIFLSILSACSHNGFVDKGMSLFHSMGKDFGIVPNLEHCACVVDLLCRASRVKEAYSFYKRMFPEPMVDVLGILLDASRKSGDKELGDILAKDILMLKPADSGNYVQLVHSYASMARWDSAGEAWIQMRSLGLRKLPGWSSIELNGTISTFFMDHSSHSQYEDIRLILISLVKESRNLGKIFKPEAVARLMRVEEILKVLITLADVVTKAVFKRPNSRGECCNEFPETMWYFLLGKVGMFTECLLYDIDRKAQRLSHGVCKKSVNFITQVPRASLFIKKSLPRGEHKLQGKLFTRSDYELFTLDFGTAEITQWHRLWGRYVVSKN
ncbi:hypothetical protein RJ639_023023 [Escallonia herrerae]|uniref:Chlororespiratory reduction 21 n=1 Tax=Escallonia herrerae TaxID=1293975 RepID=A0AA88V177_9ASTE|nr:hypothetical protein RJ639_023023 [Escallonia herrerae]